MTDTIIRQEFNIIDTERGTYAGDCEGAVSIVTANYEGTYTWYFEAAAKIASGTLTLTLHDSANNVHATLTFTSTSYVLQRIACSTALTTDTYHINLSYGAGTGIYVPSAKVVLIQNAGAALTATETQIEIGGYINTNSLTYVAMTYPKYWYYDSTKWDGTILAYVEASVMALNSKSGVTVCLQVSDGSGDNFAGWANVANTTMTSGSLTWTLINTRVGTAFTLTNGRNYRFVVKTGTTKSGVYVFNAKIIIVQTHATAITLLEPQYLIVSDHFFAGTALQKQPITWDTTDWSNVTNVYLHQIEAANGSAEDANLQYLDETWKDVTNSTISNPDNRGVSVAMTMPATTTLDAIATDNDNTLYCSRILVQVVISTAIAYKKVINEVERTVESIIKLRTLLRIKNEVIDLVETKPYIRGRHKVISEVLNLSELKNTVKGIGRVISEILNLGEAKNYLRSRTKVISEVLNLSESFNKLRNLLRIRNEVVNLVEVKNKLQSKLRVISEVVNLGELLNRIRLLIKLINEVLNIAETKNYLRNRIRIISEVVRIPEAFNKLRSLLRIVSEAVNISELKNYLRSRVKVVNEVVGIVEGHIKIIILNLIKVITEAINISEAFNKLRNLYKIVNETLRLSELIAKTRSLVRIINNTIRLVETKVRILHLVRIVNNTISIVENFINLIGYKLVKIINETIRISELVNHFKWIVDYIFISPAKAVIKASGQVLTFISHEVGTMISKAKTLIFKSIKDTKFEDKP